MNEFKSNPQVVAYWEEHYAKGKFGICTLCGNTGFVDTTATAISANGIHSGKVQYCICPNGQHLRNDGAKPEPKAEPKADRIMPRVEEPERKPTQVLKRGDNVRIATGYPQHSNEGKTGYVSMCIDPLRHCVTLDDGTDVFGWMWENQLVKTGGRRKLPPEVKLSGGLLGTRKGRRK